MHAPVVAILGLLLARALACTNVLVTPGASADGSAMLTYNADSSSMMGQMHFARHAAWPANATIDVYEWDTGKYLGKIPQVAETYNVVGNMNEYQLAITETTFGGLEQLATQSKALIDYGSLIYITLERAKTAREAISVMANLVATYGYYSEGESFSIADPHEVWIMEMIGKGEFELGAVWVAVRIPDGYISSHANQARIRQFPLNDPERAVYSPDVISFAKAHGFYPREAADSEFSFSDTYHPVTYTMARACEGRVWSVFRRFCGAAAVERYTDYVLGANLTNRMPLWVLPARKLTVNDTMMVMRDHYEGTVMDFTQDVGAGAYGAPYRWTLMFNYGGHMYQHERAIGVPQTGFAIVTQSRAWLPREIGSLIWFGVDDASTTVYFPAYVSATKPASTFVGGDIMEADFDKAWWAFGVVANFVYPRWDYVYPMVLQHINEYEARYLAEVPQVDEKALEIYKHSPATAVEFLTQYSAETGDELVKDWFKYFKYLFARFNDGVIKTKAPGADRPVIKSAGYPQQWLSRIVKEDGDRYRMPDSQVQALRNTRVPKALRP